MTCSEARHWISFLHSDWTNSPTLYPSVLHENDDQGRLLRALTHIYSSPPVVLVFFLLLFFLLPVERVRGCSRILRISSSSSFLSDLICSRSTGLGAASLVRPFLVMAVSGVSLSKLSSRNFNGTYQRWSADERRGNRQSRQQARTGEGHRHEHTQQHQPWRPSRHQAGAS